LRALTVALAFGLLAAGCSTSDPDPETAGVDDAASSDAADPAEDEGGTVDTDSDTGGEQATGGDYSVLLVANVDSITADGALETAADGGYDGFVKDGSAEEGYDVHLPGLSLEEAEGISEEITSEGIVGARPWETANLP